MTMWGLEKNGAIAARYGLHKTRILALGAWWLRQTALNGIAFSERRCLQAMSGRIAVRTYEVNA